MFPLNFSLSSLRVLFDVLVMLIILSRLDSSHLPSDDWYCSILADDFEVSYLADFGASYLAGISGS
jgi:hypothetical protein